MGPSLLLVTLLSLPAAGSARRSRGEPSHGTSIELPHDIRPGFWNSPYKGAHPASLYTKVGKDGDVQEVFRNWHGPQLGDDNVAPWAIDAQEEADVWLAKDRAPSRQPLIETSAPVPVEMAWRSGWSSEDPYYPDADMPARRLPDRLVQDVLKEARRTAAAREKASRNDHDSQTQWTHEDSDPMRFRYPSGNWETIPRGGDNTLSPVDMEFPYTMHGRYDFQVAQQRANDEGEDSDDMAARTPEAQAEDAENEADADAFAADPFAKQPEDRVEVRNGRARFRPRWFDNMQDDWGMGFGMQGLEGASSYSAFPWYEDPMADDPFFHTKAREQRHMRHESRQEVKRRIREELKERELERGAHAAKSAFDDADSQSGFFLQGVEGAGDSPALMPWLDSPERIDEYHEQYRAEHKAPEKKKKNKRSTARTGDASSDGTVTDGPKSPSVTETHIAKGKEGK